MEALNRLYVIIISDGLHFLIPAFWIVNIVGGPATEDRSDTAVVYLSDLISKNRQREAPYRLILSHESCSLELLAEEVIGLCELPDDKIVKLEAPVLNEKNQYLYAVCLIETEEQAPEKRVAYILDPKALFERVSGILNEREQPLPGKPGEDGIYHSSKQG